VTLIALAGVAGGSAHGTSPGSTDELRLTTAKRGASTGVVASEVFNARYKNGQLKPLRHSLIGFPRGTRFDAKATPTCSATDADFKSKGMSACPPPSKIGSGNATVVTTGTPAELGPIPLDVTVFARTDGSLMVFSRDGVYLSSERIIANGRFQHTSPAPKCVDQTEQPPCKHGEFVPRSLSIEIPARSRVIKGRRHNLVTTPPTCPRSGHWRFFDKHTFADGSFDLFVNHPRCQRLADEPDG
jgi:hypothetical protein